MKFKKLLALFLAVLMLASTFVLTASAEGTDEKKGLAWELNYFSFIPVYQENQDINADKPTLLMSGRGINNLAFLRDADQYGDLTQFDEFFSEDDKKFNDDNNKFLKIDFTQTFSFSPDYKILYATLKMVDRDKIVIDEENDPYWEGVDLYLDFGRKAIGDKMTIWDSGSPEEIDIASDVEAVRPEAAGDGSKVYHVALSRGGFLRASEMGGVQHMDAVQTRVVNPTGDEKNYRGDVYYNTQYIMAIDLEKLGILDEITPAPDARANGSDGPFIGFYAEYTSIHGDIERVDFEDYRDEPETFDEEFVYHIYTKQKLEDRESWPNTPNRFNVLSVGKHSPWDATLLYEDEARTIPRGVLVGGCYLEGDQYESVTIPAYMTPDLKECTADTEGALPVLEVGYTSVGSGVFENNPYVKHVTVPATIRKINALAFCSNYIESITFEGADTGFHEAGFNLYLSSALKDVTLPANMTVFPQGFLRKTGLTSVKLPSGLVEVREDGMRESDLVKVSFPDGFETLGTRGLYHCEDLKEIFFPASTKTIGDAAIQSCYSLEKVVILSTDCEISKTAFLGSNLRNLVIVGYPNSTVHEFAKANYYKFECYEHDIIKIPGDEATCTAPGWTDGLKCNVCGKIISSRKPIDPLGHDIVNDIGMAPTCTESGLSDGSHCSRCEYREAQNKIAPLGHTYQNGRCIRCGTEDPDAKCNGGANCPGRCFTDMPKVNNWAHAGIDYAVENGLFSGMSETTFEPNTAMTRAMLVRVLWLMTGSPAHNGENPFSDVESSHWFYDGVVWAAENGIVAGIGEGKFAPNDKITREQIAAILYRYSEKFGMDIDKKADLAAFPDVAEISGWAGDALAWANANGFLSGVAEGDTVYLRPKNKATRAQVASILMRYCRAR